MRVFPSLLQDLLQVVPHLRPQLYFKSSLTALSHAMEDQVFTSAAPPLVIANFQRERYYRQETRRYRQIARHSNQVYVLAAPEAEFGQVPEPYETIAFTPDDALAQEWHLVVLGPGMAASLVCREKPTEQPLMDQSRRFEGIWTFDPQVSAQVALLLLARIGHYRPDLAAKLTAAQTTYQLTQMPAAGRPSLDPQPFVERLVTYLQASQYRVLKGYRALSAKERRERLVNRITTAIRSSLNPQAILTVAVQELGQAFPESRCLVYRCRANLASTVIEHEYVNPGVSSLRGQSWDLEHHPLFRQALTQDQVAAISDVTRSPELAGFQAQVGQWGIRSWLVAPVVYQDSLLGMVELHHCGAQPYLWRDEDLALVTDVVLQIGVALIQAQAYTQIQELNLQLEALDRTRTNLIAIIGHELRTPLSTVQVCLESFASDPDMPAAPRQEMLATAMQDTERLHKLIQDFLTLSRLESGRVRWHLEPITLQECVDLALSSLRARRHPETLPKLSLQLPEGLPLIRTDGEGIVEVLAKLLDNACKFTGPEGVITIQAGRREAQMLEVVVSDTGRGIEPSQLEAVFDRFYQEENALRRTVGGTGLGLAICRQIIEGLGGRIWASSQGRGQGSQFHFTVPLVAETLGDGRPTPLEYSG
ncbi:MAG: GAF domain-containing protein [Gloeomargaritaceae cyanobacterium C42_A2020_066]|nr:GAF domain-containing protein [Gloeomargaritaceae cyanobacterium C42_A2020_066]